MNIEEFIKVKKEKGYDLDNYIEALRWFYDHYKYMTKEELMKARLNESTT